MNTTRTTLVLMWRHVWRYPRYAITLLAGLPVTYLLHQFIPPLILAQVLNRLATHHYIPGDLWGSFGKDLILYAVLYFIGNVVMWRLMIVVIWKLEANVVRDIGEDVFNHLMRMSPNFHANRFGGSLVTQTTKLTGAYIRIADTTYFQTYSLFASIVFATIFLLPRAPLFVLILIGFTTLYLVCAFATTRHVRKLNADEAAAHSHQIGHLADSITNVMAIKSFATDNRESRRFTKAANITRNMTLRLMRGTITRDTVFSSIGSVTSTASLLMAIVSVMAFHSNTATVFLILTYTTTITRGLWDFSTSALRNYNRAFGDAVDMVETLAIEPEVKDPARPIPARITKGQIDFQNVTFSHADAGEPLFTDLNLHITPGEKIGLVGHSGSGKTTLTKILLRFADIDSGEILIDGQNIAKLRQNDLRAHIAYVPQEPLLFHRAIRENIAYGRAGARDKEVIAAARKAHAIEFIEKTPNGYDTLVGERGVKLSGGQRQRIAIARAILKDAPILILDEATSALDSESERLIQAALWELMRGRTAIVIAHRLSTIQRMDRIVVLEEGQIIEQGTHRDLLKRGGTYAQLWAHQSGGFIEE